MIDVSREELIPIRLVPRRLPPRPSGRSVHVSAVYRWVQRGVRGVRLDAIRIGGTTYTSQEALQRFGTTAGASIPAPPPTTVARSAQIDRATQRLGELLGKSQSSSAARGRKGSPDSHPHSTDGRRDHELVGRMKGGHMNTPPSPGGEDRGHGRR